MTRKYEYDLADNISFEVPRDYAKYCGGVPVDVELAPSVGHALCIEWDDDKLTFASDGTAVRYSRNHLLRVLFNPAERIKGVTLCTLRAVFKDTEGGTGTLPILAADSENRKSLTELVNELQSSDLPLTIEVIDA